MATDPALLSYYSQLLILQYRTKPKAVATVQLMVNQSLCDGLPQELANCFNLQTAVGVQLNLIGKIVGVPRQIVGLDLVHTFFNFTSYDGTPASIGFGSYTDNPYPTDLFMSYFDDTIYTLTDFEMRSLIQLKIIYNNVFSSTKNIVDALWSVFGNLVSFIDNQDMSVTFNVLPPYANVFLAAQFLNILPKPMGVGATVNIETAFLLDQQGNILYDQQGYPLYEEN